MANLQKKKANIAADKLAEPPVPKPRLWVRIVKIIFLLLFILVITGVGFALGIYLKLIDVDNLADKYGLSSYPVIGKYFEKNPQTNFQQVDPEQQGDIPLVPEEPTANPVNGQTPLEMQNLMMPNQAVSSSGMTLPPDKDPAKIKQKEEAKRIGKLARLYGNMKPDEAVGIMTQLDDDTIVAILNKMEEDQAAKILALFDNVRAGRISQNMLRGNKVVN